jgi:hypothetical protein
MTFDIFCRIDYQVFAGQTSIHPCDNNWIWVKIDTVNTRVLHSCSPVVTISGVKNTQTPQALIDVINVEENNTVVKTSWSNSASSGEGSLLLNLSQLFSFEAANTTDAFKTSFFFRFSVLNPAGAQVDSRLILQGSISRRGSSQSIERTVSPFSLSYFNTQNNITSLSIDRGASEYHRPVTVKQLQIVIKNIRQLSPYPCDINTMVVDLQTNVKLLKVCRPIITISGLKGSYSADNAALLVERFNSSGSIAGTGTWTNADGKLVLPLDQDILHETINSFSFSLYNPSKDPAPAEVYFEANLVSFFPSTTKIMQVIGVMVKSQGEAPRQIYKSSEAPYNRTGEASPLKIRNLAYEMKEVRQSTPHSGCANSITVSLVTNVPFIPNSVCAPKLVISGFSNANRTEGMIDLTAQSGSCPSRGNTAYAFKSTQQSGVPAYGIWNNGTTECKGGPQAVCTNRGAGLNVGSLSLWSHERTEAGTPYSFTIDVTNPHVGEGTALPNGQDSPSIFLSTSLDGLDSGDELPLSLKRHYMSSTMDKSQDRPCCLCEVENGDASPLKVKTPMFCTKNIGQSTPFPCAKNTLTLTLSATTDLVRHLNYDS